MHERSLVESLLGQLEVVQTAHRGAVVEEVRLEIGPLSGVEPFLLQSAFVELALARGMTGAQLVIEEVPLSARCPRCGVVEVRPVRIACPACGGQDIRIVRGDEVRLQSVTLRETAEREAMP